ncbi:hypothetical protein BFR04_09860 [Gaetbulibacter sp. 4G1]|nr:carboxypeptidase-like regulatory domain-containing protein [Gaetbulibacter sp. 4G1]PIA77729.1 hypothetical protein BFR04_09860 [Gaetbulibacter sp. 4G1]
MKFKCTIMLFVLSFFMLNINAQKNNKKTIIYGFVKDSLNKPIANVSIFIDGVITNKKTNSKGYYKIRLKKAPNKVSVLSSTYGVEEVLYENENKINFVFDKSSLTKDKFNYTIYKKKPKRAIAANRVYNTIYDYFRDRVSGVRVSGNNEILVRGITSLRSNTAPLFVVNKSPIRNIDTINPNEIKSVSVLKGPECAAYGSRGANGVILINTY